MFIRAGAISPEEVPETERITRTARLGMKCRGLYTDHLWRFMQEELEINMWERERSLEVGK